MTGRDPTVEASVVVDAPPAAVWATLTAFDAYAEWNPLIRRVSRRPAEGRTIRVLLTQDGIPPTVIRPTVTRMVPERELSWRSAAPIPGTFEATHQFLLTPVADGEQTRFTQTETFGGVVGSLVPRGLRSRLRAGFTAMNEALAARVERETDTSHRNR